MRRTLATTASLAALLGAQLVSNGSDGAGWFPWIGDRVESGPALRAFASCEGLLDHLKAEARPGVGPYGSPHTEHFGSTSRLLPPAWEHGIRDADFWVDPQGVGFALPDLFETDGRLLLAVVADHLHVVDVAADVPRVRARWPLPADSADHRLILHGERVLVISSQYGHAGLRPLRHVDGSGGFGPAPIPLVVRFTLLDLADPSRPKTVATLAVEGGIFDARTIAGVTRVVLRSPPAHLGAVLASPPTADWLPRTVHSTDAGETVGTLLECERVHVPAEFAGLSTVSVLTLDLGGDLSDANAVGFLGVIGLAYTSPDRVYVGRTHRSPPPDEDDPPEGSAYEDHPPVVPVRTYTTELHAFDITDPSGARYRASGAVPWAAAGSDRREASTRVRGLSEHDGLLRVATIEDVPGSHLSNSAIHVFAERGGELVQVGYVGDLGQGLRIDAVRYIGHVAYVAVSRGRPLYPIDLSDPANPQVGAELPVAGERGYLRPVVDRLVLGVDGEVSLLDLSDLDAPRIVARRGKPLDAISTVWEHPHSLLFGDGLLVVPATVPFWAGGGTWNGVVVYGFDPPNWLHPLGTLDHAPEDPDDRRWIVPIQRAFVVGDTLYTVSERGLLGSDPTTLETRSWLDF